MPKSMLIDASHPEETRVVVVDDRQLEEFDFESSNKKQLKGNIYLAKVTRVEPSLQAAFVDYGGDRHGFLAFSEIHPDYYQIPQADRKILADVAKADAEPAESDQLSESGDPDQAEPAEAVTTDADEEAEEVFAEQAKMRQRLLRNYKIQEVIKRRQILLVQVVKEERGNKGAALTTYLSLAGRYCVLMPNTARGGGISRKIANVKDRARLKAVASELEVPDGMGLIIRTAGQSRNKLEIRRDYDYLLRLWSDIRDRTLESIAPCTIHEEGALVKRAIRDIYDSDINEIQVEGDEGYKAAKKVMTMLMPSRARRVKQYKEELPLFHHYQIEPQLDALHSPVVDLKSGGSIVINPTEALTAIDVNSGRATRERNIEETALRTNSEAADEIARQLRLRDVAGLVVIDFIDMTEMRNQRIVERRLRDALRFDRARIQLGRISAFGLLELSRQRLRPSFLEMSTQPCPICAGSGTIRSVESAALQALRTVEIEGMKGGHRSLSVTLPVPVAMYLLNQKRDQVVSLEQRYGIDLEVRVSEDMIAGHFDINTLAAPAEEIEEAPAESRRKSSSKGRRRAEDSTEEVQDRPSEAAAAPSDEDGQRKRRRRRRRRRRSGDGEEMAASNENAAESSPSHRSSSIQDSSDEGETTRQGDAKPDMAEPESVQPGMVSKSGDEQTDGAVAASEEPRSGRRRRRGSSRGRRRGGSSRSAGVSQSAADQPSAKTLDADPAPLTASADGQPSHQMNGKAGEKSDVQPESQPMSQPAIAPAVDKPSMAVSPENDGNEINEKHPQPPEYAGFKDKPVSPVAVAEAGTRPDDSGKEEQVWPAKDHRHRGNGDDGDHEHDDDEGEMPQAQQAAILSEPTEPRRGWWNRFVRKTD